MVQRWRAKIVSFKNEFFPAMESDDNGMWVGHNNHIDIVNELKLKHQKELEDLAAYYKKETAEGVSILLRIFKEKN